MNNAIEIKNLSKSFNTFALNDVSFSLPQGSIMGFIGENGAGKTTTIKLILNQLHRDAGTITLFGRDNIQCEKEIKDRIGVVFDESYFHENLKPIQVSKVMNKVFSNWDHSLFMQYLKQFNIPEKKIMKEFSRGMKMKLSIATALSHHPDLLILDEATSGLDPIVRNEILDIFLDFIQDEHHSIFISSHITSDLEKIADYITFIHDGQIIFSHSKDQLMYEYGMLLCGKDDFKNVDRNDLVGYQENKFGVEALVKNRQQACLKYPQATIDDVTIEDIMMFYIKGDDK